MVIKLITSTVNCILQKEEELADSVLDIYLRSVVPSVFTCKQLLHANRVALSDSGLVFTD